MWVSGAGTADRKGNQQRHGACGQLDAGVLRAPWILPKSHRFQA
jgi:hypothetical protein